MLYIRLELTAAFGEQDEQAKHAKFKAILEEHGPYYYGKLEVIAKANNGHLAIGKVLSLLQFIELNRTTFFFIANMGRFCIRF